MRPSFLSPNKNRPRKLDSRKNGFQEEGKHAFHRERLSDDTAGGFGKCRPVCPELKLHGYSGDDAECKINSEDASPETGGTVVVFIPSPEKFGFEVNQEQREAHGELRENVMKRDRECEVEPMDPERLFHSSPSRSQRMNRPI